MRCRKNKNPIIEILRIIFGWKIPKSVDRDVFKIGRMYVDMFVYA